MVEPKIVEDERLLKLLKPYERVSSVDSSKFAEEFKRLINDRELQPDPDKCIFPNCMEIVGVEIPIKRGLRGLCNFHWDIIADSDTEWSAEELR